MKTFVSSSFAAHLFAILAALALLLTPAADAATQNPLIGTWQGAEYNNGRYWTDTVAFNSDNTFYTTSIATDGNGSKSESGTYSYSLTTLTITAASRTCTGNITCDPAGTTFTMPYAISGNGIGSKMFVVDGTTLTKISEPPLQVTPPTCTLTAIPASIAPGGISTLAASCIPAATSYAWSGGTCTGDTGATCTVTPSVTTTYSVTGSNASGSGNAASATVTPFAVQTTVVNNVVKAVFTYNSADLNKTGSVYIFGYLPANSPLFGTVVRSSLQGNDLAAGNLVPAMLTASGWQQMLGGGAVQPAYTGTLNNSNSAFALYTEGLFNQSSDAGIICAAYATSTNANATNQGLPVITGNDATVSCPSVTLAATNYQDLWWNQNETGWGMSVTQHGSMIFAALYTYDQTGLPTWYVISSCPIVANGCTGEIYKVSGGTSPTVPWNGAGKAVAKAGTGTLSFTDANNGTFDYILNGIHSSKAITRQVFATGTAPAVVDYTDLWWNPNESGWGVAISQQYAMIFAAWYTYDATGKAIWYVASSCPVSGGGCTGDVYQVTGGSPLTSVWNGSHKAVTKAGSVTFAFSDANNGSMSYSINGVAGNRVISRQGF